MLSERKSILLVDDNEDDCFLVEQAWKEARIPNPLICVHDGQSALDLLRGSAKTPAFALLDIKMPGLSGFDTLKRLRADERLRVLPVIILTASTSRDDVDEAYRLGANAFFVKPSSIVELIDILKALSDCWMRFNEFPEA